MSGPDRSLKTARAAVEQFIHVAEQCDSSWTRPRAPGKWSPAQVVEHVARSLEESGNDISGRPTKLMSLPKPVRFIARAFFFRRVVKTGVFPNAKTNRAMNPEVGPMSASDARGRLASAWAMFEQAAVACSKGGPNVTSVVFGRVPLDDYIRFQELHTEHHREQLPGGRA